MAFRKAKNTLTDMHSGGSPVARKTCNESKIKLEIVKFTFRAQYAKGMRSILKHGHAKINWDVSVQRRFVVL